jgi:hypothetical protein
MGIFEESVQIVLHGLSPLTELIFKRIFATF